MKILQQSNKLGKFTASSFHRLIPGPKGSTTDRDKYIFEKAKESVQGYSKSFTSNVTDHGILNEFEAIEKFAELLGQTVDPLAQEYFPINENCGATPDAAVKDFDGVIIASMDAKCPTDKFFEQKMEIIKESKPEFQNSPKVYFVQAQLQMMALTEYNKKLGHPPVDHHYLVRYLTNWEMDDDGEKVEIDLPLEVRMFWKLIKKDEAFCKRILVIAEDAALERDALIKIFKTPILGDVLNP